MNEQEYITPYDTALLLSHNFEFGISSEFLWRKDKDGRLWQAVEDGEYYKFGFVTDKGNIASRTTMTRDKFTELFGA